MSAMADTICQFAERRKLKLEAACGRTTHRFQSFAMATPCAIATERTALLDQIRGVAETRGQNAAQSVASNEQRAAADRRAHGA